MIAVTFALGTESAQFVRLLRDRSVRTVSRTKITRGRVGETEIEVIHTGVGEKACRRRLQSVLQDSRFDLLITAGFAGALRDDLQVGDIVLAENFADPNWLSIAREALADRPHHVARMLTAPAMIDSPSERQKIARSSGAAAVDMETEVIATMARERGIPLLSLRVISDTPRQPLPAPPDILFDVERQRTDVIKLAGYLLKHPGVVWRMIAFARQIRHAQARLAQSLVELLNAVVPIPGRDAPPGRPPNRSEEYFE